MDPLSTMLGLQNANIAQYGGRNNAKTAAISKMLGIPDDGSISQVDLESANNDIQQQTLERTRAQYSEPDQIRGEYGLAQEQMRGNAARDIENQKYQQAVDVQGMKSDAAANAPPKFNVSEQNMIDAAQGISALGGPLLAKYAAKYPGIDTDPQKYGSPFSDALTAKLGKGVYSFGGMTDNDELLQESAAIEAWGTRALQQGRLNQQQLDIIRAHLPQPGFSPGANYDRLSRLLKDVLPSQLQGVSAAHGPSPLVLR